MQIKTKNIFVALFFLALTFVLTFPVALRINSAVPIAGGDVYQVVAKINGQSQIIAKKGFQGLAEIYESGNLNMNTAAAFFKLSGVPLFTTYNLFFLFSYFASALGAYLLAYYFTKNTFASLMAGIIFAFAPFHHYQAMTGHAGTMHQEWLPFFVLFLWRWFDSDKLRDAILTFVFLALIALTEHHLLAFTSVFVALFISYHVFCAWKSKTTMAWKKIVLLVLGFMLIAGAFFTPYLNIAVSDENYLDPGASQVQRYSMPIVDLLITPPWHSIWPGLRGVMTASIEKNTPLKIKNIGEGNSSGYVGYGTLVLLAVLSCALVRKKFSPGKKRLRNITYFWIIIAVVFFIFSLGISLPLGKYKIPLPYDLVYRFAPFFENIRTVDRFYVYALLAISVLTAISLDWFKRITLGRKAYITLLSFVLILTILEFLQVPIGMTVMGYSPFYNQLAKESADFKILEIPGSTNYDYGSFLRYVATIHGKESLSGIVTGRKLPGQYDLQKETPLLKTLLYDLPKGNYLGGFSDQRNNLEILNKYQVRYITVSKIYMKKPTFDSTLNFIKQNINTQIFYEDASIVVFETK